MCTFDNLNCLTQNVAARRVTQEKSTLIKFMSVQQFQASLGAALASPNPVGWPRSMYSEFWV